MDAVVVVVLSVVAVVVVVDCVVVVVDGLAVVVVAAVVVCLTSCVTSCMAWRGSACRTADSGTIHWTVLPLASTKMGVQVQGSTEHLASG